MWKFVLHHKQHFFRFSIYPFAAGILLGSSLKKYVEDLIHPQNDRHILLPNQFSFSKSKNLVLEKFGIPSSGGPLTVRYSSHIVHYDTSKKVPLWVLEHMTKESLKGNAERNQCFFQQDKNIPKHLQGKNEDFLGSGYARGHMIPASDVKDSQEGMKETFFLTNIVPQDYDNNGGFWYRIENYCRTLTNKFSDVYVVSGPLFLPNGIEEKKFIKFRLIGENEIAVPSHLYKVVMVVNNEKPVSIAAFVVPNTPISDRKVLKDFQVPLDKLEQLTGFSFFPNLKKGIADLCYEDGCKMLSKSMADIHILRKNLKRANSMEDLDKLWRTIQEKDIQLDKKFMDKYWDKRKAIENNSKR